MRRRNHAVVPTRIGERLPRPRRARAETGATLVEYALVVSVFLGASLGALSTLNAGAQTYFEDSSERVGRPINQFSVDDDGLRPGGGETGTTTTVTVPDSSTSTTLPTSTSTSQVSTTTTTSTTTTSTTTTTVPASLDLVITDRSYWYENTRWKARAKFQLSASGGATISGVKISSRWTTSTGSVASGSCTTGSGGSCTLTWSSRRSYHLYVDVDVTDVASDLWSGSVDGIRLDQP